MSYFFSGRFPVRSSKSEWRADQLVVTALDAKDEDEARSQMKAQLQAWLDAIDAVRILEGTVNIEQKIAEPVTL